MADHHLSEVFPSPGNLDQEDAHQPATDLGDEFQTLIDFLDLELSPTNSDCAIPDRLPSDDLFEVFQSREAIRVWTQSVSVLPQIEAKARAKEEEEAPSMADRFPSLEDIDAGETEARGEAAGGDFLERERAALGADADLFSTSDNTAQLSSLVRVEDGDDDDDLLGGGGDFSAPKAATSGAQDDDLDGFESSFPAIDTTNDNVGPGGTITSTTQQSGYTNYNAPSTEEDTEPIRAWRAKRDADIKRRDEASAAKKAETIARARQDIDAFYESYNRKVDKQKAAVRKEEEEFLAKRQDTTAGGTSWERIEKLVDLSGKGQSGGGEGSSKRMMRNTLLSLKADKNAPGASGT